MNDYTVRSYIDPRHKKEVFLKAVADAFDRPSMQRTPTKEEVEKAFDWAAERGLNAHMKAIVDGVGLIPVHCIPVN